MSPRWTVETHGPDETIDLGRRFGRAARPGDILALVGELGGGKTHFAKGLAEGLGAAPARDVTSPTFVLCHEFLDGRLPFYHLDAYRLSGAADFEALGSDDILGGNGLSAVEWADRVAGALPDDRLQVRFEVTGETLRRLTFDAAGPGARRLLDAGRNA